MQGVEVETHARELVWGREVQRKMEQDGTLELTEGLGDRQGRPEE